MHDRAPQTSLLVDLDTTPYVPMWRLALARKPGLETGQRFGPIAARQRGLRIGDSPRYRALCGLPADGPVPLLWAFLAAAPLQKALLLRPEFPVPLLGLVHVSQAVWAARPLLPEEELELEVQAGTWRPARRGVHIELDTSVRDAGGATVWWARTTAWSPRGPGHGQPNPSREPPALEETEVHDVLVPEHMGRRYGTVAGDRNPIHVHALLARPFGFQRAIVHGMWTVGRSLAALGARLPTHTVALRAEFLRPVELPSRGQLEVGRAGARTAFVWRAGGRCCVWGTVEAGVGGAPTDA